MQLHYPICTDILLSAGNKPDTYTGECQVPRQHQSKAMKNVMAELERLGFQVNRVKSGVYKIVPPPTIPGPMYTTHGTESALHPMRRDFKRMYGVELKV